MTESSSAPANGQGMLSPYRVLGCSEIGKYHAVALAFRLSRTGFEVRRAPLLGEHNEHVLKDILHMGYEEIAELIAGGVVE